MATAITRLSGKANFFNTSRSARTARRSLLRVEPLEERALLSVMGSIVGYEFNDLNANGIDDNEPRLANVTVELDAYGDETVDYTTTTDANGVFRFNDLFANFYRIRQVLPTDNFLTTAYQSDIELEEGKVCAPNAELAGDSNNFVQVPSLAIGNFHLAKITGRKFDDLNGDGKWDEGEPTLTGVSMRMVGISDLTGHHQDVPTTTDEEGAYFFGGVPLGTFTISEQLQSGWMQTGPTASYSGEATQTVKITTSGQLVTGVHFGNFKLGSISGSKFNDLNANGIWDQDEPALANVMLHLTGTDTITNTLVDRYATTDASGNYSFADLAKGDYTISELLPNGWIETNPDLSSNGSATHHVSITTSGTVVSGKTFGNYQLGTISGSKFNDLNANGVWDQDEAALSGWSIRLTGTDTITNTIVDQIVKTDSNGAYLFAGLGKGDYTISEVLPDGWTQTAPVAGSHAIAIDASGTVVEGKDFGNYQLGKVSGSKFNDLNGNGVWDHNEPGLAGWTIHLRGTNTLEHNAWIDWTATTDSNGKYSFTGLGKGQYVIEEELVNDWLETSPDVSWGAGALYSIDVSTSGTAITGRDFGNFQLAKIQGAICNDLNGNRVRDNGEPLLAGWTVRLTGIDTINNKPVDRTTTTDADGYYYFGGLPKGNYTIQETSPAGWIQTGPGVSFDGKATQTVNVTTSGSIVTNKDFANHRRNIVVVATVKTSPGMKDVAVVDADNSIVLSRFSPYESHYMGGVCIATGDLDGDGVDEIITAPSSGRAPEIRVFHQDGTEMTAYRTMAYESYYTGGVQVAVADVNGDAKNDIITIASSGSSRVKVFLNQGAVAKPIQSTAYRDFMATSIGTNGGVVAAADMGRIVNGAFVNSPDGKAEIIVGSGTGSLCAVGVYDVSGNVTIVQKITPFSSFYGGVVLTTGRIDADAIPDLVISSGIGGNSRVDAWTWNTSNGSLSKLGSFNAFVGTDKYASICVAGQDTHGNGSTQTIFAVQGAEGTANHVRSFQLTSTTPMAVQQSTSISNLSRPYYIAALQNCGLTSEAETQWFATWNPTPPTSPATFVLGGPTGQTYANGETVAIQWSASSVPDGSKVSLCYDEDTTWWNGNEHWIQVDQVAAGNGLGFYNWNTAGMKAGNYYLAGYLWANNKATFSHLNQSITIKPGAQPTFSLTNISPTTYKAGESVTIAWNAANVAAGSKVSLCYDEDTTWWNGNEHWIEIDQVNAANGGGSYQWNTSGVKPGKYYVAGYLWSNNSPYFSRTTHTVTIEHSAPVASFSLTGPTGGSYHAGDPVDIHWTANNVGINSKISLCYDEDVTWWNGNEHWIEIDQVAAANGAGSYQWDTTGVKSGVYYMAGYLWSDNKPTFSHLSQSISIGAAHLLVSNSPSQELAADSVNLRQLDPIVAEAKQRLAAANGSGVLATLADVRVELTDLADNKLAEAAGQSIRIDRDAAGRGWFVDTTPSNDGEYVSSPSATLLAKRGGAAEHRVDLLTAVIHEMGHILGAEDNSAGDLMDGHLSVGVRRSAAIDRVFETLA